MRLYEKFGASVTKKVLPWPACWVLLNYMVTCVVADNFLWTSGRGLHFGIRGLYCNRTLEI